MTSEPLDPLPTPAGTAAPRKPAGVRRHWGKGLLAGLSIVLTGGALWLLARQNQGFSFAEFAQSVQGIHLGWLAVAAALSLTAYVFRSLRWTVLVRSYTERPSPLEILANTFIGFAAVVIIGRPAELLRPYLIARQLGVPFSSQVGAWILERIYDLLSILALAGWALLTIDSAQLPAGSPVTAAIHAGGAVVLATTAAALAILLLFTFAADFATTRLQSALAFLPESRRGTVDSLLSAFASALSVSRKPQILLGIILWTILHWAVVGLGMWATFQCFPASRHLGLTEAFQFLAILAVASAIPLPFLVGGYYLVSLALLTEWLRLPLEDSSGITTVCWLLQMGLAIPLGAIAALRSGLNWRRIKSMEQEAHL